MTIKYIFAKNVADLEKIQASAVKSVTKAREQVQIAAVATIKHAHTHGDWTYAQRLVDALGNTINGTALVEWFKTYGGLETDDNGFVGWKGKDHIEQNFAKAKEKMWWELKKPNPFKGFDLEAALQRVLKEANDNKKKIDALPEEDKAKVKLHVNDATIRQVLALCNFEAIITDDGEEEQAA